MMRCIASLFRAFFLCTLVLCFPLSGKAQLAALTIGSVIQNISELAKQIENGAQALIQQGNSALAQQQMLAAGILRQLVVQLNENYKGRLDDTFESLAGAQSNVVGDLDNLLNDVRGLESKAAKDVNAAVYKMQGSMNQLLNKIPFVRSEPAYYGMIVHDAFSELPKAGYDIEMLGLNFTDSRTDNRPPLVHINGVAIPPDQMSIQDDRVQIIIPENLKLQVGFGSNRCSKRQAFRTTIQVFYKTPKSFMFIPYNKETSVTYTSFALEGLEKFLLKSELNGIVTNTSDEQLNFSTKSGEVTYECEANNSGSVSFQLPDGAKEVNCNASWIDVSNTSTRSASCAVGGSTVTASGTARGRDRECIVSDVLTGGLFRRLVGRRTACNCPGGGHASLLLNGNYKLPKIEQVPFSRFPLPEHRFERDLDIVLPSDNARRVTGVYGLIYRDQCSSEVIDRFNLDLPKDSSRVAEQSSVNGLFKATYRSEGFHLERIRE